MEKKISYFRGSENGNSQYNSHGHHKSQVLGTPTITYFFHESEIWSLQEELQPSVNIKMVAKYNCFRLTICKTIFSYGQEVLQICEVLSDDMCTQGLCPWCT